ncbi:MAG: hypothetical protein LAT68_05030 [Cyclobacteriaceae bacterium]|nr:hypothetical protein [Cyclobacteriaceae bacterium]MCH8515674.1 hypothetical protein [Cyclobacteriaceae bacterium]
MIYLLLSILCGVALFLSFRSFKVWNIPTFPAIVLNYWVCVAVGMLFFPKTFVQLKSLSFLQQEWLIPAILIGAFFIFTFQLMAKCTQLYGVSLTTVASKTALAVPVMFSLFVFDLQSIAFNFLHYLALILVIPALVLSTWKQKTTSADASKSRFIWLPIIVFALCGITDTVMNYASLRYVSANEQEVFTTFLFFFSALSGTIYLVFSRQSITLKSVVGGIYLGVPNFFSIYFLLMALDSFANNGAKVYPSLNVGTILLSSLLAVVLFKEKISRINQLGLILAVLTVILLFNDQLF